jgi:putative copper export protein
MYTLYTLSVFVHVVAACAWVGSMIFFAAAVVPVLRRPEYASLFRDLVPRLGARFRVIGWGSLVTLVATGACNLWFRGVRLEQLSSATFWSAGFGKTLAYKLVVVVLILLTTAAHDALTKGRPRTRQLASWLGRGTLALSVVVLLLAVWLARGMPT